MQPSVTDLKVLVRRERSQDVLREAGVAAIYPPGTNIPEAAREILTLLRTRHKEHAA